ncbi:P1 family peptidase [Microbacterium oxydans]|nr:P1 family peptidase [Microbacterium oxydans]
MRLIPWGRIDPFLTAAVQAVDEAVWNALVAAQDMTGRDGHRSLALPARRDPGGRRRVPRSLSDGVAGGHGRPGA